MLLSAVSVLVVTQSSSEIKEALMNNPVCTVPDATRQAMYVCVLRNSEARSYNHCCSGKPISITYSECAFLSLRNPACNGHAPYCHMSGSTEFFHIIS